MVVFPAVQRHRYFRLKRRLPGVAGAALRNAALAVGLALGADLALNRGALSVGAEGVAAAALAAALCSLCWLWGEWDSWWWAAWRGGDGCPQAVFQALLHHSAIVDPAA